MRETAFYGIFGFLRGILPLLCLLACTGSPVVAQVKTDTLQTAVITSRAKPSATLNTKPLQVMERRDFEKLGLKELHEAVKTFSGVQIKDYGGIGGVKSVSIRSLGSQHTAVSYDGVTISNAQSGQVDIGRFNLDNIALVTLAVGPSDDIFQTARMFASAGSLNITTARPEFGDKPFQIGAALRAGSFGTWNPSLNYRQKLSGRWSLTLNGDWLKTKGSYPFTLVNGQKVTHETRDNSDVNAFRAEMNIYGDLGKGGEITIKGNYSSSERGLPGPVILYVDESNQRLWDENGFAQVHYRNPLGRKWVIQAQLKYNYSWNRYREEEEYYPDGVKVDRYKQQEYYGSAGVQFTPWKGVSFVLAEDFFYNTMESNLRNFVYPHRYSSLTALAAKYVRDRFTATASVLGTFITENVESGIAAPDRHRFSPAASISYQLLPHEEFRVRVSYQDVFRTPTFNDLYYLELGNTNLKPEIARQLNLGLTWKKAFQGVLDQVSLQADGYYNLVKDKIIALPSPFIWKMMNMDRVQIIGTDVNASALLSFAHGLRLDMNLNYSFQHAVDITDPDSKNYRDQVPYTPRHSGTLSASFLNRWVNVGYFLSAVGPRYALPQNIPANRIDGYLEHTLSLHRVFRIWGGEIKLQAECLNFTNRQYDVIQFYPMPGRSFRFTVNLKY